MRRTLLLALVICVALPGAAFAAKAKISPDDLTVTSGGVTTVEAKNPNGYVLRGKATVVMGGKTVASKSVKLPKRSTKTIRLKITAKALATVGNGDQPATVKLKLRRAGGKFKTVKRTLALRRGDGAAQGSGNSGTPGGSGGQGGQTPGGSGGQSGGGTKTPGGQTGTPGTPGGGTTTTPPPASNRWVGRFGGSGAYDDVAFTLDGDQLTLTKPSLVPVTCAENGLGHYGVWTSYEVFNIGGPWTVGVDQQATNQAIAVNKLVGRGERTITYKLTETAKAPGRVTGKLGMSFSDSKLDFSYNPVKMYFINCWGSATFEAVPAP